MLNEGSQIRKEFKFEGLNASKKKLYIQKKRREIILFLKKYKRKEISISG